MKQNDKCFTIELFQCCAHNIRTLSKNKILFQHVNRKLIQFSFRFQMQRNKTTTRNVIGTIYVSRRWYIYLKNVRQQ